MARTRKYSLRDVFIITAENRRDLDTPKAKCLDASEEGSCDDNECFCPCDCEKNNVAFKTLPADSNHGETLEYIDSLEPEMNVEGSGFEVDTLENSIEHKDAIDTKVQNSKSLDIKIAQTNDIINQINQINKKMFNSNTTSLPNDNDIDKNGDKCYCHCKCCNKNEDVGEKIPENKQLFKNTR